MNDQERQEFEQMKRELAMLKRLFVVTPTIVRITKTLQVDGGVHGDRIYTQRNGTYVELTT